MKNKKEYMIIFVTVAALLIDILGREFAVKLPTILFMEYLLNRN